MDTAKPPDDSGLMRVEIHTGSYLVLGAVQTRHERLIDLLTNLVTPYLLVKDAFVQPLQSRGREGFRSAAHVLVNPDDIRVAMPYEPGTSVRSGKSHPRYVPKYAVPARLYLNTMQVDGNIYIPEGQDAFAATQTLTAPFIAVTDAQLRYLDETFSLPFAANIVVVNRSHVHLIALEPEVPSTATPRLEKLFVQCGAPSGRARGSPPVA